MRFILSILFSLFMCAPSLAVIQSQNSRNDYIGTGLVTVYPYTFKIFNQNELVVTKRSILGVETVLSVGTDYTVSGVNNKNGGNVTLNVALPSGEGLVIRRVVDIEQNADIRNQGAYYPDYIEKAMDSLVMNDQTIKEQVDRSLKLSVTTNPATFSPTLPTLMTPESVLVTKVDGTGFEIIPRSAFKGDQGEKGDTGEFTSFEVVGELEYTDPTPMSVTNVGTATDAQLEFILRKGPKGDPGTTSYAIYTEVTNPTGADGNDGDIWINTVTGDLFQKETGTWNLQGNIQGPTGPAGGVDSFNTRQGAVVSVAGDYDADQIVYDNAVSGLTAVDVQAAVDEIVVVTDDLQDQINNFDSLPAQAGNAGKYLSTDGTNASWETVVTSPTMQNTYVNSTQPQITLNSTQLGLQVRDASTPIGSTLFAIQNNAGSTSYLGVDVNGISVSNFVGSGTTGAVRVHNLTTTQKNALTPAAGMIVYDTTLARFECYTTSWAACGSSDIQNSDLTLTASDTLAISITSDRQTWLVQGGASAVDMSTTPFGSSAPVSGAEITLIGNDDTFVVFFPTNDAAKGIIGNSFTLSRGQVVTVKYNATLDRYVIKSTSN